MIDSKYFHLNFFAFCEEVTEKEPTPLRGLRPEGEPFQGLS